MFGPIEKVFLRLIQARGNNESFFLSFKEVIILSEYLSLVTLKISLSEMETIFNEINTRFIEQKGAYRRLYQKFLKFTELKNDRLVT